MSPLHKKKANKNFVLNLRPVSILSTVSKMFGKIITYYYMNCYFLPFLSKYMVFYTTQHLFLRLIEEWNGIETWVIFS